MAEMETHHQTKMTPSTAQQRADLIAIAKKLVLQVNEITPAQWDKQDDKDHAIILAALQATRQEALREAAKVVRREIYLGLPNITATQRTVTVNFVHGWMQGKIQRIADELDRLASEGA